MPIIQDKMNTIKDCCEQIHNEFIRTADLIDLIRLKMNKSVQINSIINITQAQNPSDQNHPYRMGFSANSTSSAGNITDYEWSGTDGIAVSGNPVTIDWPASGQKTLNLTITDSAGNKKTNNIVVNLASKNAAPQVSVKITSVGQPNSPQNSDYRAYVAANASSNVGSITKYDWYVDGSLVSPDAGPNPRIDLKHSGSVSVKVIVTDTMNNTTSDETIVNIAAPQQQVNVTVNANAYVSGSNNIIASATASASNGAAIAYYYWYLDGNINYSSTGKDITFQNLTPGQHSVWVIAQTAGGQSSQSNPLYLTIQGQQGGNTAEDVFTVDFTVTQSKNSDGSIQVSFTPIAKLNGNIIPGSKYTRDWSGELSVPYSSAYSTMYDAPYDAVGKTYGSNTNGDVSETLKATYNGKTAQVTKTYSVTGVDLAPKLASFEYTTVNRESESENENGGTTVHHYNGYRLIFSIDKGYIRSFNLGDGLRTGDYPNPDSASVSMSAGSSPPPQSDPGGSGTDRAVSGMKLTIVAVYNGATYTINSDVQVVSYQSG